MHQEHVCTSVSSFSRAIYFLLAGSEHNFFVWLSEILSVKKVCRLHCRCIYRNVCPDCKQGEIVTNGGWNHADLTWRLFINEQAREFLDCKTGGSFFSKSVKKSVKRGVRVLHARSARASDALRACEARQKKHLFLSSLPSITLRFHPRSRPFA